jgi:hypothetical protein
MIAEFLSHTLSASPAAVGPYGRGDGLPDLTGVGLIGPLEHRHEQGIGPDRAGDVMVSR